MSAKPPLVVTMGDPAGIGPEVAVRALAAPEARAWGPYVLAGSRRVLEAAILEMRLTEPGEDVELLDCAPTGAAVEFGRPRADLAAAAALSVEEAGRMAVSGRAAGLVTAPLSKEGLLLAGRDYPGHTEMLGALCGTPGRELMMLVGGGLRVALVTTHLALADVPAAVTAELVERRIRSLAAGLAQDFGLPSARIAVLALNPHAGEGGRFGGEEAERISPAITAARASGIRATGPHPADSAFHRALSGEFDAVLAMYHDQGLGVLKALAFDSGVNVTLGLPIVRTSPDHGTAYDIAGRGRASPRSMLEALRLAREISNRRTTA